MRLVAFEIADRSPDPSQVKDGDALPDGSIRSRVWLEGHEGASGKYIKGLTDYTGMEARQICAALAALAKGDPDKGQPGYEMRIQHRDEEGNPKFDSLGRPVFGREGRTMRFKVPPLNAAGVSVDNPDIQPALVGTENGSYSPMLLPETVATPA